ncbi:MAG: hypothetical protein M5T52_22865 [Ignavibacteriaceae bacterium]|nr:hypothetical protein [Ignavibacteriaceae bacterium]
MKLLLFELFTIKRYEKTYIQFLLIVIITSCENSVDTNNFIPVENAKTIDTEPDWSHEGKYIAYVHFAQDSIEKEYGNSSNKNLKC